MNIFDHIKEELSECMSSLHSKGKISQEATEIDFSVEVPREKAFGELSTNLAMVLGKTEGCNPRRMAEILTEELKENDKIVDVEIAGPGFLNFAIDNAL